MKRDNEIIAHVLGRHQGSVGTVHCKTKEEAFNEMKKLIDKFREKCYPK